MHSATELPLHGGKAPRWLFERMVKLSRAIGLVIIDEFGPDEFVKRVADPYWFQALSCAIGYDWHSSGTTTVTMGALKEALNDTGEVFIAGGKGKTGLKTPEEITKGVDELSITSEDGNFKEKSRLAAKVDSSLVYDNIGIYQHTFMFSKTRKWAVIQQGMFRDSNVATRFQWFSDLVDEKDIANEPHSCVDSQLHVHSLDLTSKSNTWARQGSVDSLEDYGKMLTHTYPHRHKIKMEIDLSKRAQQVIEKANEIDPKDFKELLLIKGMGRATIRSLAFVSSLIFDKELAYRDPIVYAYNLGGKDRIPFEINRKTYDSVVSAMENLVDTARIESKEKYYILKRLNKTLTNTSNI